MRRRVALGLATATLVLVALANATAATGPRHAVLAKGHLAGGYRWHSAVSRAPGAGGQNRPCIEVELEPPVSAGPLAASGHSRRCQSLSPMPQLSGLSLGDGNGERTVLSIAYPTSVRRVHLELAKGSQRNVALRPISRHKARKARIKRFSYTALGFAGRFCLHRFTAFDASGQQVDDSGSMPCNEQRIGGQ